MAHHQHLHVRQGVCLRQPPLRGTRHITGDEDIKIPRRRQCRQPLLVQVALRLHRRVDCQRHLPQRQLRHVLYEHHVRALLLCQRHQPLPHTVFVLDIRQVQRVHRQPRQQRIQAVGMIGVVVGHHHALQPVQSHALQPIRRHAAGVHIAVAAAAVHQRRRML